MGEYFNNISNQMYLYSQVFKLKISQNIDRFLFLFENPKAKSKKIFGYYDALEQLADQYKKIQTYHDDFSDVLSGLEDIATEFSEFLNQDDHFSDLKSTGLNIKNSIMKNKDFIGGQIYQVLQTSERILARYILTNFYSKQQINNMNLNQMSNEIDLYFKDNNHKYPNLINQREKTFKYLNRILNN